MLRLCMMGGWVGCLWLFAIQPVPMAAQEEKKPAGKEMPLYWIFLTTGKDSAGLEKAERDKMQKAHLDNFGKLHGEGKLFAAGPMGDPQKKKRGIVVATAPDAKGLADLFEPDPLVKQGYLTVDASKMKVAVGEFRKDFDQAKFHKYGLVLLEKATPGAAEVDADGLVKNQAYCESIHDADRLCFAAWLREEKERRGILIFRELDAEKRGALVNDLPAVKGKNWKATHYLLYMSDGVVK